MVMIGMASVRLRALHLVGMIVQVMVVWLVAMRMIAMQMAAVEMTPVLIDAIRAMIMQQTAGCCRQQIGCNGNSGRKPTGEHGHLSKTTKRASPCLYSHWPMTSQGRYGSSTHHAHK
jgi:hypothetical protein